MQNASVHPNTAHSPIAGAVHAPAADQHALLADPTRRAILRALGLDGAPIDAHQLAAMLGLHVNSVRDQLRRLVEADRVVVSTAPAVGRGRPRMLYAISPGAGRDPHRALVLGLVDQLAEAGGGAEIARAAGRHWGQLEASAQVRDAGPDGLEDALVAMLSRGGFEPERSGGQAPAGEATIRLRACPYLPLSPQQLRVVCGVHLGYLEGVVRGLGAADTAVGLAPFGEPDACLANLAVTGDPAHV